ncbi:hypothetical protein D3C81_545050 [compost metagenome]
MEGVEDFLLLLVGDADAGILYLEAHVAGCIGADVQGHGARIREFDGVRQQVFQDLLQALAVADKGGGRVGRNADVEGQFLLLRLRAEQHLHAAEQFVEGHALRRQFQFTGFDLGNIEDIVDQGQ